MYLHPQLRRAGCGYSSLVPSLSATLLNQHAVLCVPSLDFFAANAIVSSQVQGQRMPEPACCVGCFASV
jgi:hypothetical protein